MLQSQNLTTASITFDASFMPCRHSANISQRLVVLSNSSAAVFQWINPKAWVMAVGYLSLLHNRWLACHAHGDVAAGLQAAAGSAAPAVPVSPAMSPALNVGFMATLHAICRTAQTRVPVFATGL